MSKEWGVVAHSPSGMTDAQQITNQRKQMKWSNIVFLGKTEYRGKKHLEQRRELTNSVHTRHPIWESNPRHIGGKAGALTTMPPWLGTHLHVNVSVHTWSLLALSFRSLLASADISSICAASL